MSTVVMVFARAPRPGRCKTRLVPALGAAGAAALQAWLVHRTLQTAVDAQPDAVELWCTPDTAHPCFESCRQTLDVRLRTQPDGDLGARMAAAFACGLGRHGAALLIGCDAPSLGVADLRRASAALADGCDTVITPAEDGGYVLIGLTRPEPELFRDMIWGTDGVLAETLDRLRRLGRQTVLLPARWDVDRPADLDRLRAAGLPGFDALLAEYAS